MGQTAPFTAPLGSRRPRRINSGGLYNSRGIPVARNLYDDAGRLVGVIDSAGRTNIFEHDLSGRREIHYDRGGNATTYRHDTRGNVTEVVN